MIKKKLLQLQKENIILEKDGTNPHFKSHYVTLNAVLKAIKPRLSDLNVLLLQSPTKEGLTTSLVDLDDDSEVSCFMPYVETTSAQKIGSNNTYNRRYSLITLLGLEDDDDDGNEASKPVVKKSEKPVAKTKDEIEEDLPF